ncbi:MAG TPA: adenylyl-sulfate kinase [Gaiellaceae bacterium]|nr:adenylyl-sulfate kinase [Gaiellaceae bacterium]
MTPARRGFTLWLTGLSGAGKTTVGDGVAAELERAGKHVERLDGDAVREHLSAELGFSKEDRDVNVARIAWVASRLTRAGAAVVVSAISPYAEARRAARALIEAEGDFVEVFVAASVAECARRDPKGLYDRALRGELPGFTGITAPYEEPVSAELRLDTESETPATSVQRVLEQLRRSKLA